MLFDKSITLDMGDDTNRDMLSMVFRIVEKEMNHLAVYCASLDSLMRVYHKIYTTAHNALTERDEIAFSECIEIPTKMVGCIIDRVNRAIYEVLENPELFGFDGRETIDVFGLYSVILSKRKSTDGYIITCFNTDFQVVPVYDHNKFVKVTNEIMGRLDTFDTRFWTGSNSEGVILDAALDTMKSIDVALCGKVFNHMVVVYLYYAVMEFVRKKSYTTDTDFTLDDVIASIPTHIKIGIPDEDIKTVFKKMHAAIHDCAAYAYRDRRTNYISVMGVYEMLLGRGPLSDVLCSGFPVYAIELKYEYTINHEYTHTGVWRCLHRPKPLYRVVGRVF